MKRSFSNLNEYKEINKKLYHATSINELKSIYKLHYFDHVNISTCLNKYAKLNKSKLVDPFIYRLMNEMAYQIKNFKAQEIANTLWSLATLGIKPIDLLIQEINYKIKDFKAQEIANTLWSLATLNIKPKIMNLLIQEITYKVKDFNAQEIANTLWSFATLNIKPKIMNLLVQEIIYKIKDFNAQNIANTLWSLATLGIKPKIMDLLVQEINYKIETFNSQNIANTLWALATLGIKPQVIDLLTNEIKFKIEKFNAQEIANTLWSFATLNIKPKIIELLIQEINYKIKDFTVQGITNTLWSFAVLDIFNDTFLQLLKLVNIDNMKELIQIDYIYLYLKFEKLYPIHLNHYMITDSKSSALHLDCAKHLKMLNISFENEKEINHLIVDICIEQYKIVIEVNGPSHYIDHEMIGPTVFKNRLLLKMGWHVLHVPYYIWNKLNTPEKLNYLTFLLNLHSI